MAVTLPTSLICTVITIVLSVAGLLIFRRLVKPETLNCQHDVADPYSQFVGMLFAVLLGFMVADAMARFGDARHTVEMEASSLGNVFRMAEGLSARDRDKVQQLCLQYCHEVSEREWPMLANKKVDPVTRQTYRRLWHACNEIDPQTGGQSGAQQALLPCMASLGDYRRLRADALHNGLSPILWVILVVGGIATIIFTYFFNAGNLKLQTVMVSMVSLVICLNIFLLASYDDPFSGDLMIKPTAFESLYEPFAADINDHKAGAVK